MPLNIEAKKHPKIHISATKEKNQYLFSIKDNGIGMSLNTWKKYLLFSNDFTLMRIMKEQELDLQLHKKLYINKVDRYGLNQNLGKGSTFYFTIPINPNILYHNKQ